MSLVFYYSPMSSAVTVHWALEELGVPYEKVKIDLKAKDNEKPAFLALNPNGKVPLVVHDGTPIFESAAITMYLGETFGVDKKLYPPPGPKRGLAMKWIVWTNVTLGEAVYRWARNTQKWVPDEQTNAKAAEAARADVASLLGILDAELASKPFLAGEYTLADTHVNSFVDWLRHMKIDMAAFAHLGAWSKRCSERPAYKAVMARG
jgi:glutathione S-transferase